MSDGNIVLPLELVEATDNHGPYICNGYGGTVCDFYTMSNPESLSVRNGGISKPILFADAAEYAAFMTRAANVHHDILAALKEARDTILQLKNARWSEAEGSDDYWVGDIDAAIAKAEGRP